MEVKFFKCSHCGNIVEKVFDSGVPVVCCGDKMEELIPNTTDAATEKHVPVILVEGSKVTVQVGSVLHPMEDAHYIQWICLVTEDGIYRKVLKPGAEPKTKFALEGEKAVAVYEYCNLHGLWKKEI